MTLNWFWRKRRWAVSFWAEGAVEEVEIVGAVLDAVAEDFDGAAFGDLALEAGEELAAGGAVFVEAEGGGCVGLGGVEERAELDEVDAVLAVVVVVGCRGTSLRRRRWGGIRRRCGRKGGRRGRLSGPCR